MINRIRILFVSALFLTLGLVVAFLIMRAKSFQPMEEPTPTLEAEVSEASRIAVVQVRSIEPANFGIDPNNQPCGFRIEGSATENLKGRGATVLFYTDYDTFKLGRKYLVFLKSVPSGAQSHVDALSAFLTPEAARILSCKIRAASLFLPVDHNAAFEFLQDDVARAGEASVVLSNNPRMSGIRWCSNDSPLGIGIPKRNLFRAKEIDRGRWVVNWGGAKALIKEAIGNPPYWWRGIPNPFFKRAGC